MSHRASSPIGVGGECSGGVCRKINMALVSWHWYQYLYGSGLDTRHCYASDDVMSELRCAVVSINEAACYQPERNTPAGPVGGGTVSRSSREGTEKPVGQCFIPVRCPITKLRISGMKVSALTA